MKRLVGQPLTSDATDTKFGSAAFYVAAVAIPVLVARRLPALELTEKELLFGVLLMVTASLLCVLLGLVLPVHQALRRGAFGAAKADEE